MFVCDKCKKPIEAKKMFGVEWESEISFHVNGKRYDLCDDCYKELKEHRNKAIAEFFGEGDEDGREG